ncbi:hypothetical protein A0H81_00426 [Grifola frondosa]|nr:hypothetical protein A0H81_00426 [Grifola frondosa]
MTASDEVLSSSEIDEQPYYPYPNQSSFTLHNWFWNDGVVKSQSSFRKLTKIISHPEFKPEDIARTNWQRIDARLADVEQDANISQRHEGRQYSDKWTETPITISVPFHAKMHRPGPQDFGAGILHHRKLVSVIREKVSNPESHPHFHYEPYELHWQPEGALEDVRVFGEMYTSQAFVNAHRDLQLAPGEPGCDLPRVVVALMFASDATHLTDFGSAKLWPLYLSFGNESKYRRGNPSCNHFEHVAYFESVRNPENPAVHN